MNNKSWWAAAIAFSIVAAVNELLGCEMSFSESVILFSVLWNSARQYFKEEAEGE